MRGWLSGVTIIFDLDGTLIDTAADLGAAMNCALRSAGLAPAPLGAVRHLVGHGARAMLKRGFAVAGRPPPDEAALDAHVRVFLDYYLAHIADASRPFPFAIDAIDDLTAQGAQLAICTNKREAPARLLLETLGHAARFASIVGMDTTEAAKPDPRPVLRCLADTGDQRAVFVGDSDTDIEAATRAGIPCLVSTLGYGPVAKAGKAAHLFGDFRSLPALAASALRHAPHRLEPNPTKRAS